MTIGLVGQDQITTFTSPVNGTSPIDANVVRGNDNTVKTAFNLHDADATVHLQSSLQSARPPAGVPGRKWLDSDTYRLYYDDGAAWHELAYVSTGAGGATINGPLNVNGAITATGPLTASPNIIVTGTNAQSRGLSIQTLGVARWYFAGDYAAESGGNAGTNLVLQAYSDAGALIDTPFIIPRAAAGTITIGRPTTVQGAFTVNAGVATVNSGLVVSGARAVIQAGMVIQGPAVLAAAEVALFSFEAPATRYYIGDGSGYSFVFSKRSGGATSPLVTITDQGSLAAVGNVTGAAGGFTSQVSCNDPTGNNLLISSTSAGVAPIARWSRSSATARTWQLRLGADGSFQFVDETAGALRASFDVAGNIGFTGGTVRVGPSDTSLLILSNGASHNAPLIGSQRGWLGTGSADDAVIAAYGTVSLYPGNGATAVLSAASGLVTLGPGTQIQIANNQQVQWGGSGDAIAGDGSAHTMSFYTGNQQRAAIVGTGDVLLYYPVQVGSNTSPGTYQLRVTSTTGDRVRMGSGPAGQGAYVQATDAGESGYRPLNFQGSSYLFGGLGGGTGALSVGAADSGGAGFRMLRVPN